MISSAQTQPVEVSAYDGVVIFTGLGREPIVLAAEVAERIGYNLCAAAYAASHNVPRTWREDVYGMGAAESAAVEPLRPSLDEPRSFRRDDPESASL